MCEPLVYHGHLVHERLDLGLMPAAENPFCGSPVRIIDQFPPYRGQCFTLVFGFIQLSQSSFGPCDLLVGHVEDPINDFQLIRMQCAFSVKAQATSLGCFSAKLIQVSDIEARCVDRIDPRSASGCQNHLECK
jgi:hypothetical protein